MNIGTLTTAINNINPNTLTLVNPLLTELTTPKCTGKSRHVIGNTVYQYDINPAFWAQSGGQLGFYVQAQPLQENQNLQLWFTPTNGTTVQQTGSYTVVIWVYNINTLTWSQYDVGSTQVLTGPNVVDLVSWQPQTLHFLQLSAVSAPVTQVMVSVDGASLIPVPYPTV